MKFSKGTSRYVIEVGNHVIKAPKTNLIGAAHLAFDTFKNHGIEGIRTQLSLSEDLQSSLRGMLFAGLKANRREERVAKKHPEAIIATKGILGVINIQPRAEHPEKTSKELSEAFQETMGEDASAIAHEVESPDNFGVQDGEVIILDGGSHRLERCLEVSKVAVILALDELSKL